MSESIIEPQRPEPPQPSPFQFGLGTLLLLFAVLGSSLALFGGLGVIVFALAIGLALYVGHARSLAASGIILILLFIPLIDLVGVAFSLLFPVLNEARETGNWTPILKVIAEMAAWLVSVCALVVRAMQSRKSRTMRTPSEASARSG